MSSGYECSKDSPVSQAAAAVDPNKLILTFEEESKRYSMDWESTEYTSELKYGGSWVWSMKTTDRQHKTEFSNDKLTLIIKTAKQAYRGVDNVDDSTLDYEEIDVMEQLRAQGLPRVADAASGKNATALPNALLFWDRHDVVKLLDVETGECRHTFNGYKGFTLSPSGHLAVMWGKDAQVIDMKSGLCQCRLPDTGVGYDFAKFSQDQTLLLTIKKDAKEVGLWDATTGKKKCIYQLEAKYVEAANLSPDASKLFVLICIDACPLYNYYKYRGAMFDTASDSSEPIWKLDEAKEKSGGFSHDGLHVLIQEKDYVMGLYDATSGLALHNLDTYSAIFSPDGSRILMIKRSPEGRSLVVRSAALSDEESTDTHGEKVVAPSWSGDGQLAWSPDGTIIFAELDRSGKFFDVEAGVCLRTFGTQKEKMSSISFSIDSKFMLTTAQDAPIRIFAVETGECVKTLGTHSQATAALLSSPVARCWPGSDEDEDGK